MVALLMIEIDMTKSKPTDAELKAALDLAFQRSVFEREFDALMVELISPDVPDLDDEEDETDEGWWFRLRTSADFLTRAVPHLTHGAANTSAGRELAAGGGNPGSVLIPLTWEQDNLSLSLQTEGPDVYLTITPAPDRNPFVMCWIADPDRPDSDVVEFELSLRPGQRFLVQNLQAAPFKKRVGKIKADRDPVRFLPFVLMD